MKLLEASFLTFSVGACALLGGFFELHHMLDLAQDSETINTLARDARILLFGSFVLALLSNIVWLVWLYPSWKFVHDVLHPDEDAPSPFRVVALSLVPLFNIFWQLVSVVGLCSRMNASLERALLVRHVDAPKAPCAPGLAISGGGSPPCVRIVCGGTSGVTAMRSAGHVSFCVKSICVPTGSGKRRSTTGHSTHARERNDEDKRSSHRGNIDRETAERRFFSVYSHRPNTANPPGGAAA